MKIAWNNSSMVRITIRYKTNNLKVGKEMNNNKTAIKQTCYFEIFRDELYIFFRGVLN